MADTVVAASLSLETQQANQSLKSFKQELRQAQQDVVTLSEKFGATSKEALNAAKRAAELKDRIADAKTLTDAFNPDQKFRAFSQALGGMAGGFAAVQGAMSLLGTESEDVTKALLKVQSAMALSQGLNALGDSIQSVKNLGAILVQTLGSGGLIGVAIAGVGLLAAAFSGLFSKQKDLTVAQKALNDTVKDFSAATAGAIQKVNSVKTAFGLARSGVISKEQALKTYNETLGDSLGKTNDLAVAEKNVTDKADDFIKITGLKAQAQALFAVAAQKASEAIIKQDEDLDRQTTFVGDFLKSIKSQLTGGETFVERAARIRANAVQKAKDDSASILKVGEDLLRQVQELSKTSGVKTETDKPEVKKGVVKKPEEDKEILEVRNRIKTELDLRKEAFEEEKKFERERAEGLELIDFEFRDKALGLFRGFVDNKISEDVKLTAAEQASSAARILRAQEEADEKIRLAEAERNAKVQFAQDIGGALGTLSDLIGRQTVAGKVLAIAQATINTWLGATEVLRTKSVLPEPAATIAKIANVAAVIASGLTAVKNIVKTQVPGGGSAAPTTANAPLSPTPQVSGTQLNQQSLNQIGNATVRAFVLETDIANNSERLRRLNRASRIG